MEFLTWGLGANEQAQLAYRLNPGCTLTAIDSCAKEIKEGEKWVPRFKAQPLILSTRGVRDFRVWAQSRLPSLQDCTIVLYHSPQRKKIPSDCVFLVQELKMQSTEDILSLLH